VLFGRLRLVITEWQSVIMLPRRHQSAVERRQCNLYAGDSQSDIGRGSLLLLSTYEQQPFCRILGWYANFILVHKRGNMEVPVTVHMLLTVKIWIEARDNVLCTDRGWVSVTSRGKSCLAYYRNVSTMTSFTRNGACFYPKFYGMLFYQLFVQKSKR